MSVLRVGGIVVCGGKSTRMGQPKLALPYGDELLLPRICRVLAEVVAPIVVVAAEGQAVPTVSSEILIVRDEYPEQGPLAGIATGLAALATKCDAAYVTSCDVPLLKADFVRGLISELRDFEAVVPVDAEHVHVLAGVYRTSLAATARELLQAGRRRPLFLIEEARAHRLPVDQLRTFDPDLASLRNINTPEDYASLPPANA